MQRAVSLLPNFLTFFLVLGSIIVMFTVYANTRERRAGDNWTQTFGDIENIPKQYRFRYDNDAAVKLEFLGTRLGFEFAYYGERRRYPALYSDVRRFQEVTTKGSLFNYFRKGLERSDEMSDPPSAVLAKYLSDYQKKIEEIRDHILTSPQILWEQNLKEKTVYGTDPGFPSIWAISNLEMILTVRALQLVAVKNYVDAEKYLEAGWRLNDSLKSRPELDLQLQAIQIDQKMMGLMRKLPVDRDWIPRIMSHNYEKAIIRGFKLEAWYLWRIRNEAQFTRNSMLNQTLDPYIRLSVASLLENERNEIQQLEGLPPCSLRLKDFREVQPNPPPKWNRIPKPWNLLDKNTKYGSITKLKIDRELTAKIIQVRHGYFPKGGIEKSETCKDGVWNFSRLPDGSTSIQYAGRLELPTRPVPNLPTSFVVKGSRR